MSIWQVTSLGELCEITGGNSAPQGTEPYDGGTMPFVRMRDLGRYHFTSNLNQTDDKLTEEAIQKYRMKIFEPGCILFPRSGSVFLNHRAILGTHASIVSHIGVMQNFSKSINVHFLYYFLQTYDMTRLSKKTTGVDSIAFSDVKRIEVPIPPLPEQERIVHLLGEVESLRAARLNANESMSQFVPALFNEIFGNVIENKKRWKQQKLGDVCEIRTGKLNSNAAVENGKYPFFTCSREIFSIDTYAFDCEAVLLSGNNAAGDFDVKLYKGKFNAYQRTYVITIKDDYADKLDYLVLKTTLENNLSSLKYQSIGGLTKYLTLGMITSIQVPLPPLAMQREFAARVEDARVVQEMQRKSAERIEALWQSMLARAFAGEI